MSNNTESSQTSQEPSHTQQFHISENAAKRIEQLIEQEDTQQTRLRISVLGGGCSGFQYNFDFDEKQNDDDNIFNKNNIQVIIDTTSLDFVNNSTLDYVETLGSAAFVITNPNATANCGCGNSFSV